MCAQWLGQHVHMYKGVHRGQKSTSDLAELQAAVRHPVRVLGTVVLWKSRKCGLVKKVWEHLKPRTKQMWTKKSRIFEKLIPLKRVGRGASSSRLHAQNAPGSKSLSFKRECLRRPCICGLRQDSLGKSFSSSFTQWSEARATLDPVKQAVSQAGIRNWHLVATHVWFCWT